MVAKIYTDDVDIDQELFDLLERLFRDSMRTSAKNADSLGKAFLHVVKEAYENGFHNGLNRHKEYTDRGFDCSNDSEYGTLFPLKSRKRKK